MQLVEYLKKISGHSHTFPYLSLGLSSSVGKIADLVRRAIRNGNVLDRSRMREELGDVIWYWTQLVDELGLKPEEILDENIEKLKARQVRGAR